MKRFISFYSNEQFDYYDGYQVENLEGFIEGKKNYNTVYQKIEKIKNIYVCYKVGSKLFRDLYVLGSFNDLGNNSYEYKIEKYIINYKTDSEKIITDLNIYIGKGFAFISFIFPYNGITDDTFKLYILNYGYYQIKYRNLTYNNVDDTSDRKVLSMQFSFTD